MAEPFFRAGQKSSATPSTTAVREDHFCFPTLMRHTLRNGSCARWFLTLISYNPYYYFQQQLILTPQPPGLCAVRMTAFV